MIEGGGDMFNNYKIRIYLYLRNCKDPDRNGHRLEVWLYTEFLLVQAHGPNVPLSMLRVKV